MSFRISVESVIFYDEKVLLVKRALHCKVAPNVWNVPAGKVDMLETTAKAVVRETLEETNLQVEIIKLLAEEAFQIKVGNEPAYRNMFTYLTRPIKGPPVVKLNDEHTEFKWVTEEELEKEEYASLMPRLKAIIIEGLNHAVCK